MNFSNFWERHKELILIGTGIALVFILLGIVCLVEYKLETRKIDAIKELALEINKNTQLSQENRILIQKLVELEEAR